MIPNELLDSYSELKQADIRDVVELSLIKVLTSAFQIPVTVVFDPEEGLSMTGLPPYGDPVRIGHDKIGRKLKRHILFTIENELQKRQTVYEAERLRQLQGKVLQGSISLRDAEGNLLVDMELSTQFRRYILHGVCPLRYQPSHERDNYVIGKTYYWFVSSVVPIANHRQAKVRIRLSRVSKELPAVLLRMRSGIDRIICHSRIPGGPAEIITAKKIPKDIINSVGKETGDIYRVRIIQ